MPSRNPNRYRENPYAGLPYVIRRASMEAYGSGAFHLVGGFLAAVEASTDVNEQVRAFADAMSKVNSHSRIQLAQYHTQVAQLMQAAVVKDYRKAKAQYGRNIAPYRLTTRDAGGKLAMALGSSYFYRGTHSGIGFGNVTLLDNTARQWHRLNFGAGSRGSYTPRMYQARFGNLVAGAFGYTGESPSAGFAMPRGVWTGDGAFYPKGRALVKPTRGIKAWNFLEAGPRVLAQQLGPAYDALYRDWFASAQRGYGPLSRIGRPPPAPRRRAFLP